MVKVGGLIALMTITASAPASADGALAIGTTPNMAVDGIAIGTSIGRPTAEEADAAALKTCREFKSAPKAAARCRSVGTFKSQCYAVSLDPTPGMRGAGWAIAASKEMAEQRALENCKATAGAARREFCQIAESRCDE